MAVNPENKTPQTSKLAKAIFKFLILKNFAKPIRKLFLKNSIINNVKMITNKIQNITNIQTLPTKIFAVAKIATTANKTTTIVVYNLFFFLFYLVCSPKKFYHIFTNYKTKLSHMFTCKIINFYQR